MASLSAILGPVTTRIEKKLSLNRSGSSRTPPVGAESGTTWIVTDGSVGMEAQGIAVAEAVTAFRFVPARLMIYFPPQRLLRFVASNEPLAPPWPRLLVSVGRRIVPIALALKQVAKAFALHIQNPKVPKHRFDLIAAPVHDRYTGGNVINTFGAVHSVTAERLAGSVESFAAKIDPLPPPARRRAAWRR